MLKFLNPEGWKRPKGYSNVVTGKGRLVFVAGQIGWNAQEQFETDDFAGQVRQALANTIACLATAGAGPQHIARMTWYVRSKPEYMAHLAEIGAAWRDTIGRHYPAMTLVEIGALFEDRARVEIETTALVPD